MVILINLAIKYRILRILLSTLEMLAKMYEFLTFQGFATELTLGGGTSMCHSLTRYFHAELILNSPED